MVWKDLKHQLHSSTATGSLHILNFHLRLLQACLQGLSTFKNVKPPGLLRPECLHHGLLWPFPDITATHQHTSIQSLWLFSFCPEGLQQVFSLLMLTGLSAASSFWGMLTNVVRILGTAVYRPPKGDSAIMFHDYLKIRDNLVLKKRLRYLGIATSWIVWLCPLKSILVSSWEFLGNSSLLEGVSESKSCFKILITTLVIPCLMVASAAVRQGECFKSLLNDKNIKLIINGWRHSHQSCDLWVITEKLCWLVLASASRYFNLGTHLPLL